MKKSYSRKVTDMRESFKKAFVDLTVGYNANGMPRPAILDMRDSQMMVNGMKVVCMCGPINYIVTETEEKGVFGWIPFETLTIDNQAYVLDIMQKVHDGDGHFHTWDPFTDFNTYNKQIAAILGM